MRARSRCPIRRPGEVGGTEENTLRSVKPPAGVTVTRASSPSSARRGGRGRSAARSISMRLLRRALRLPTSPPAKRRSAARSSNCAEPREPQRVGDGALEVAVRPLDRAVLVRHAAVVACRGQAQVDAQRLVSRAVQSSPASRSRLQNAAERLQLAVLPGGAAEGPQRVSRSPAASATNLSPPSTTWTCSKPLKARRKWWSRCAGGAPATVTPSPLVGRSFHRKAR